MTILYLDVTQTWVTGLATGIQRVVRKVTSELLHNPVTGIDQVCPVVALNGAFMLLDDAAVDLLLSPAVASAHTRSQSKAAHLMGKAGALFPLLMSMMQRRSFRRLTEAVANIPHVRADTGPDDLVLLLDAFWGGSDTLAAARASRQSGATIVGVVYDLIPVTHPHYMTPVAARLFERRLREALDLCDGFVAISKATAAELKKFAHTTHILTGVAYCGSDVVPLLHDEKGQSAEYAYISVSTLEPRKGHGLVLDAFERLWAGGSRASLTFVGRRGWDVELLWRRCQDLMASGAPFRLIDDADDAVLAQLLADSSAAIVASAVEGFGLPVVEALSCNIPVFASDIPVFQEFATEAVAFFDASDPGALADAILAFERDPIPMRTAARRFIWPTWREAAPGFAQTAIRISEQAGHHSRFIGGQIG